MDNSCICVLQRKKNYLFFEKPLNLEVDTAYVKRAEVQRHCSPADLRVVHEQRFP